ncbi:peptidoglycan/xylan/chitin deacetylase (PgdA/CDA1 family) [Fontibacillus solani]|uniref:Peptidoglycan/xylan/chitin deacetylase (PgdA/CDA1 family) n=1 Tax=Fontibacillus solani TaxID=1572857 RepID=A0A7W3SSU9_9BACL|nr:peptidoglycan/xylan/chitin deacetylase (PgdA/CDA1 family) [Fontibacillus solani]
MISKKIVALATACILLSSCSQLQSKQENNNKMNSTAPSITAPAAADSSSSDTDQTNTDETADNSSNVIEEPQIEAVPPVAQYHINKAYNVVPNDESISKKVVLLTFDDGPKEQDMINGLLDTLDKHQAKAIFFVNGYRVKANPDLLKQIHDRGQIVGNHSWDHIDLKKENSDNARKQVEDVQEIVEDTIGERPRFFRPPFGSGNENLHKIAEDNGLIYMTWSNGSLDWDSKSKNKPDVVIQNVMDQLHNGSNILMHELPWTVEALDELLTKIEEKGYSFVDPRTISQAP